MVASENRTALKDIDTADRNIFGRLLEGVEEEVWQEQAAALRMRGYSVFDLRVAGNGDVEIISPDCMNWWQLVAGRDGLWRLC